MTDETAGHIALQNARQTEAQHLATTLRIRFEEELSIPEPMSGCWLWLGTGYQAKNGFYGSFTLNGRPIYAHRLSWMIYNKSTIPPKMVIRHKCDNPSCVNPDHLIIGTVKDNIHDCIRRGRKVPPAKGRNGRTKLTFDQVRLARIMLQNGRSAVSIAAEFGVGSTTIDAIKIGRNWAWLK